MSHYKQHIFFCTNQRDNNRQCCQQGDAFAMRLFAKKLLKQLGLSGEGGVRVSQSGCLGRCSLGPNVVIYPEGVWYTYHSQADVEEIIRRHVVEGEIVSRLLLKEPQVE